LKLAAMELKPDAMHQLLLAEASEFYTALALMFSKMKTVKLLNHIQLAQVLIIQESDQSTRF
jgi:hypothetical protein